MQEPVTKPAKASRPVPTKRAAPNPKQSSTPIRIFVGYGFYSLCRNEPPNPADTSAAHIHHARVAVTPSSFYGKTRKRNGCANPNTPRYHIFGPRRAPGSEKQCSGIPNTVQQKTTRQNIRKRVRNSWLEMSWQRFNAKSSDFQRRAPEP